VSLTALDGWRGGKGEGDTLKIESRGGGRKHATAQGGIALGGGRKRYFHLRLTVGGKKKGAKVVAPTLPR